MERYLSFSNYTYFAQAKSSIVKKRRQKGKKKNKEGSEGGTEEGRAQPRRARDGQPTSAGGSVLWTAGTTVKSVC